MYKRNGEIKDGDEFPEGMQRIALGVEYNGAEFNGFQKQATAPKTVQAALESALSSIANEEITLVCAGRTDAGVHAAEQVVHFDTLAQRPNKAWLHGVNTKLPPEVRVHWVKQVGPTFHARFSATARTYRYVIYADAIKPACLNKQVTWTSYSLDQHAMAEAAKVLEGEHDFSAFRSSQCQANSPVRHIEYIHFYSSARFMVMEIKANAFLHHMVRNIIGSLMEVGRGAKQKSWLERVLAGRDRNLAAATAAPWGLYFVRAHYPVEFGLPETALGPIFIGDRQS